MTRSPGAADERLDQMGRMVPRSRLTATIGDALDSGSLILTAGAGFGKTTVLEQALEGRATAWLSCSEAERAAGTLMGGSDRDERLMSG